MSTSYSTAVAGIDLNPFGLSVSAALSVFEYNSITGFPIGFETANDPDSFSWQQLIHARFSNLQHLGRNLVRNLVR